MWLWWLSHDVRGAFVSPLHFHSSTAPRPVPPPLCDGVGHQFYHLHLSGRQGRGWCVIKTETPAGG